MPPGGKRPGAGRPRGSRNKKTRAAVDGAAKDGPLPLDVMLQAMRHHLAAKNLDRAAAIARDAAPYLHARLTATTLSGPDGGPVPLAGIRILSPDPSPNGHAANGAQP